MWGRPPRRLRRRGDGTRRATAEAAALDWCRPAAPERPAYLFVLLGLPNWSSRSAGCSTPERRSARGGDPATRRPPARLKNPPVGGSQKGRIHAPVSTRRRPQPRRGPKLFRFLSSWRAACGPCWVERRCAAHTQRPTVRVQRAGEVQHGKTAAHGAAQFCRQPGPMEHTGESRTARRKQDEERDVPAATARAPAAPPVRLFYARGERRRGSACRTTSGGRSAPRGHRQPGKRWVSDARALAEEHLRRAATAWSTPAPLRSAPISLRCHGTRFWG